MPADLTNNPYLAPAAAVDDVGPADAGPPRPRAVVVTLVVGWILFAAFLYAVARFTLNFVTYWSALSHAGFAYLQIPPANAYFYYRWGAYLAGGVILCGPVAWWLYAFTLSRKARAWFEWARGSAG